MKKFILLLFVVYSSLSAFSQDAGFTQYNASRIYTNPAFAGTDSTLVLSAAYRIQWPKTDGGYKTIHFTADQYIRFLRGGIGINYLNDNQLETFKKTSIDLMYSRNIGLFKGKLRLCPAFQISYFKNTLDWSKLTFGDMIDARLGYVYNTNEQTNINSKSNIDFSAGLLLYTNHYYGGIAVHHLTQPDEGLLGISELPIKTTIHAGTNLSFKGDIDQKFILSPNILYMKQKNFQTLMLGVTAKYKIIVLGLSYRNDDALIINGGIQNRFLKIGYSYDYTVSSLTNKATGGAHEIQLTWFLHYQKKMSNIKTLRLI